MRIEDYAIIGDTHTLAVVGRDSSIDWLCLPRFDSGACFAALVGGTEHGRWILAPSERVVEQSRRYRKDSLILESEFRTDSGIVRLVDFMPVRDEHPHVVRLLVGVEGTVTIHCELVIRFDYGKVLPWVRKINGRLHAVAGPDALLLETPVVVRGEGLTSVADFVVRKDEQVPFVLTWYPSHRKPPPECDPLRALAETEDWWKLWVSHCQDRGPYRDDIVRSLVTLKALTYQPTGSIVAAGTTSIPEAIGGERNWDYRFCWLRDSTATLYALLHGGFVDEARAFRDWLLRAVAGDPAKLQIMYGLAGERTLDERTLDWLPGYEGSRPVRVGNAAADQLQLDVYGEVSDTFHQARRMGIDSDGPTWELQKTIVEWLESAWEQPDDGLWESRGTRVNFTHSRVMSWVAFDRAVKAVEQFGFDGPLERWRAARDFIHREICTRGFDPQLRSFTRSYDSKSLDASLLLIPSVGFLPATDERVSGTISAVERELLRDGLVLRYLTKPGQNVDGLHGREGAFLACSFWLVDAYLLSGRVQDARLLFERLRNLQNDVGLLAEEYDPVRRRLVGNFPQAFSHVALVNSARNLTSLGPPPERRRE